MQTSRIFWEWGICCYDSTMVGEKLDIYLSEITRNTLKWVQETELIPNPSYAIFSVVAHFFTKIQSVSFTTLEGKGSILTLHLPFLNTLSLLFGIFYMLDIVAVVMQQSERLRICTGFIVSIVIWRCDFLSNLPDMED